MNYAVDKKRLLKRFIKGEALQRKTHYHQQFWSYNDEIQIIRMIRESEAAFSEAGYPNGFETDFWIQPVVRASNPNPKRMAELVMADWAKVGVKANPVTFEWADYQNVPKQVN